ncbi:RDD family protein [Lacticaseibacillus daqingensis]|uniref:RDD family protein n=1 Tax=Lacticaseibacillus daqingensis TaxID=2486014 RepID=UPI000F7B270A|nr:RDD family protein [Lacticaseibacillus daqingensis]
MSKHRMKQERPAQAVVAPVVPAVEYGRTRVYATGIDWLVGGVVSGLPGVVAYAVLTGTDKPMKTLYAFREAGFSAGTTMLIAALCLLFGLGYYVIVPWLVFPGQTLGKRFMHLRMVKQDGQPMHLQDYLLRQVVGLVLIEGAATATATYVRVMITAGSGFYVDGYFSIFWNIVTLFSMFLVFGTKRHLALHDYLAKTQVVAAPMTKLEVV